MRGLIDRLVGGMGLRRGRPDPVQLRPGDPVDFFRVLVVREAERLSLISEMKLPGEATLEFRLYPNVADLHRGKTRQSAPDVAEHSLGQIVAYLTVCEILADASTGADGVLWWERSSFCRCGIEVS